MTARKPVRVEPATLVRATLAGGDYGKIGTALLAIVVAAGAWATDMTSKLGAAKDAVDTARQLALEHKAQLDSIKSRLDALEGK